MVDFRPTTMHHDLLARVPMTKVEMWREGETLDGVNAVYMQSSMSVQDSENRWEYRIQFAVRSSPVRFYRLVFVVA